MMKEKKKNNALMSGKMLWMCSGKYFNFPQVENKDCNFFQCTFTCN